VFLIVIDTAFLPKRDTRRTRALMAHLSLRLQWVRDEWIGRLVGVFDDDTPASFGRLLGCELERRSLH